MSVIKGPCLGTGIAILLALCGCNSETDSQRQQMLGTIQNCDAATETCQITVEKVNASLSLGPGVKPLVAFPVRFTVEETDAPLDSVIVDFQMQGMDMGMNRYRLQQVSAFVWEGTAILPVCTTSRMDWKAIVEFSLGEQPYQLVYPFQTETN